MDLKTQVRNSTFLLQTTKPKISKQVKGVENTTITQQQAALQRLANEEQVPYGSTFRMVTHTFNVGRAPFGEPQVMRKHPGYIRNEKGGFFTS